MLERELPKLFLFFISMIVILSFYFGGSLNTISNYFINSTVTIVAISILFAAFTFIRRYVKVIMKRKDTEGMLHLYALALTAIMVVIGLGIGETSDLYNNIFNATLVPVQNAFWAILGLYTLSAAVKALKARTVESWTLLIVAFITILYNAPIAVAIWPGFETLGNFVFNVVTKGPSWALSVGAAAGAIAMMIRTIIGIDKAESSKEAN